MTRVILKILVVVQKIQEQEIQKKIMKHQIQLKNDNRINQRKLQIQILVNSITLVVKLLIYVEKNINYNIKKVRIVKH